MLPAYFLCRQVAFGNGGLGGVGRGMPNLFDRSTYLDFARRETAYLTHLLPPLQPWLVTWRDAVWTLAGVAALVVGLAFGWTLDGHFVGDDFGYAGRYADFPLSAWPALFTKNWTEGLFDPPVREPRPVIALT